MEINELMNRQHYCLQKVDQLTQFGHFYLHKLNSSWREITGIDEDVEILFQKGENTVSNPTSSLQQHHLLSLRLKIYEFQSSIQTQTRYRKRCERPFTSLQFFSSSNSLVVQCRSLKKFVVFLL